MYVHGKIKNKNKTNIRENPNLIMLRTKKKKKKTNKKRNNNLRT